MPNRVLRGVIAAGIFLALSGPVRAGSFCDPSLAKKSEGSTAYREREGRCEGIYAQQVGTVSLDVRALVAPAGSFDPNKDRDLLLGWAVPPGAQGDVRLRAFSFRPNLYYRMDSAVPAASASFRWPTEILASLGLKNPELGVIGWIELPRPEGSPRKVYLPLRTGVRVGAPDGEGYEVTVVPSERLRSVHVTVSRLDADGREAVVLRRNEELGYGYYAPGKPTPFFTGKLGPAGFYRVEVAVTPMSGSPLKQGFELYHPGS